MPRGPLQASQNAPYLCLLRRFFFFFCLLRNFDEQSSPLLLKLCMVFKTRTPVSLGHGWRSLRQRQGFPGRSAEEGHPALAWVSAMWQETSGPRLCVSLKGIAALQRA